MCLHKMSFLIISHKEKLDFLHFTSEPLLMVFKLWDFHSSSSFFFVLIDLNRSGVRITLYFYQIISSQEHHASFPDEISVGLFTFL